MNIGGHARLGTKFELQGFYTWSHTTGNMLAGADEFRITDAGHQGDLRAVRDQTIDPLRSSLRRVRGTAEYRSEASRHAQRPLPRAARHQRLRHLPLSLRHAVHRWAGPRSAADHGPSNGDGYTSISRRA